MIAFGLAAACRGALIVLALSSGAALARDQRISFAPGASGATVSARIAGDQDVAWVLGASQGQHMTVTLTTDNASANFNVQQAGAAEALFNSAVSGPTFSGILPQTGDYRIVAYLMRNAARRNEAAMVTLDIRIEPGSVSPDFADGLTGGPDWWQVEGLSPGDTLNLRAEPSASAAILARMENGDILRNHGCTMVGSTRWCQVSSGLGKGWAAGRYLRESAGP